MKANFSKITEKKELKCEIILYLKSVLISDVDNFTKGIFDSLVEAGIIPDDRYIIELNIKKVKSSVEGFDVFVK